jgi:DNA-binding NarL/FixJ family response regulator
LQTTAKTVAICDTVPVSIEGLRAVLTGSGDLRVIGGETSLINAMEMVARYDPDVVIVDKSFGIHAIMDWIRRMKSTGSAALVWGLGVSDAEAIRLVQAGAAGVMRKTADVGTVLMAVRAVASGRTWMDDGLMQDNDRSIRGHSSNLTARELQVLELVEQGMRNKDIANALGIQAGTVKIHLKHIFEKTGIRGRYGLALTGLREKGLLSLPTM